jgi:hypothetical protein
MDGMQLPYEARCFRAVVVDPPEVDGPPVDGESGEAVSGPRTPVSDGADTDMLLIDFR